MELTGYVDADFANDLDSRKSTSGLAIFVGGSCVSWRSKRQNIVTTSTSEAEYVAASVLSKEIIYVTKLYKDFNLDISFPIEIQKDNRSCIAMTFKRRNEI